MRVLFLMTDYVLHNSLVTEYLAACPDDRVALVKIPLVLKGKGRRGTADRILPQLSRRFVVGKLVEFLSLAAITAIPKLLPRGPVFRRLRSTAARHELPFHRTENVMEESTLQFIRDFEPDVVVSLCHQILKDPLIRIPRFGVVNVHPGILPEFRGIQPYFWELSEGAGEAGATLHLIEDERIDAGGILGRTRFQVEPGMSVQACYYLTILTASRLLPSCLEQLQRGELEPQAQNLEEGGYFKWPDSEAFTRLREQGHSLISLRQLLGLLCGSRDRFQPSIAELHTRTPAGKT